MGYLEENKLHEDSFSKAICKVRNLDIPEKRRESTTMRKKYSIPTSPFGMFEMAMKYDIVKGKLADGFFEDMGPSGGKRFQRFKKEMQALRRRNTAQ